MLNRLKKSFGSQISVNNLSFEMYENQIFALLGKFMLNGYHNAFNHYHYIILFSPLASIGHNGAGKTTTINMLTGIT